MLAALRDAHQSALARRIGRILQHGCELLVLGARFLPLMRVVEVLCALVLQFSGGVGKFTMKLLVQARQRGTGVVRFIGQREFVVERLVILGGGYKVACGFIGASTLQEQAWLGGSGRICSECIETILRTANLHRRGHVGLQHLLLDGGVRVVVQKRGEILNRFAIPVQGMLALRGPKKRVLAQKRVGLGFLEPGKGLLCMGVGVFLVAQREGGALSPNAGGIFVGEGGELFVGAGNAEMNVAGEQGQLFLHGGVFGSRGIERRRRGIGLAAGEARGRFGLGGFFLFVGSVLWSRGDVAHGGGGLGHGRRRKRRRRNG